MTQLLRTGGLPLLSGGEQSAAAPQGAGPGGGIRLRNGLIVGPGAIVQQPDILLAAFGGQPAFDAFTGANGTALSAHAADAGLGTWQAGTDVNSLAQAGASTIQTNAARMTAGGAAGGKYAPSGNKVGFDHVELYADLGRADGGDVDTYQGLVVRTDGGPAATYNGLFVRWVRVDASTVDIVCVPVVSGAPQPTVTIIAGYAWASGTGKRLGVALRGNSLTVYTEPTGGGARTTFPPVTLTGSLPAAVTANAYVGLNGKSTAGAIHTWDNFTVVGGIEVHACLGIFPFEQQGGASAACAGIIFLYDKSGQFVLLAQMGEDLTNLRGFTAYSVYTQALPPQMTGFEMFGKFYYNEFARQTAATRKGMGVFDPAGAGTITVPTFVLNGGAATSLRFRGIAKHRGATIIGWGYDDEITPDGPHILRYSKYLFPDTWVPDGTETSAGKAAIGTLNVPIIACAQSGQYTIIGKQNEIFLFDGDYSSQFYARQIGKANGPVSTVGMCSTGPLAVWMSANGPVVSQEGSAPELIGLDQITRRFLSYMDLTNAACAYDSRNSRVGFGLRRKYDDHGDPVASTYLTEILWWDHVRNVFYPGDVPRQFWCLGTTKGPDLNLPGPSGVVANITASKVTSHSAEIAYTPGDQSPDVTFVLEYRQNGTTTWVQGVTSGQATYSVILQNLLPSTHFDVRIAEVRNSQTGTFVESLDLFTTQATGAVEDPTTVTVEEINFIVIYDYKFSQVRCKFSKRLADFDTAVALYRNIVNNSATATKVAVSTAFGTFRGGSASGELTDPQFYAVGVPLYYWLREENARLGTTSAFVQATPAPITIHGEPT